MDMLGILHVNQTSMCLDPHQNLGVSWCRSRQYFFCVFFCYLFLSLPSCNVYFLKPYGHPLGKG